MFQKLFYEDLKCSSAVDCIYALAILLLPYDGLPILPTTYRPISVFPLIAGFVYLCKVNRDQCLAALVRMRRPISLLCACVSTSFIVEVIFSGDYLNFTKTVLTLGLGMLTFLSLYTFYSARARLYGWYECVEWTIRVIATGYIVPLILGIVELLALSNVIDYQVFSSLQKIFGAWQFDRIFVTTREASWASVHMLIALISYLFMISISKRRLKGIYFILAAVSGILFIFTKAMQGFLIAAISIVMLAVWFAAKQRSIHRSLLICAGVIIILIASYYIIREVMLLQPGYYYAQRFLNFTGLEELIRSDASSFIRITSPVICIFMMLDSLPFGIGGCAYGVYYSEYINRYYPWALSFPEVASRCSGDFEASPFCLYTRVCAEYGILGGLLLLLIIYIIVKGLLAIPARGDSRIILVLLCLVLVSAPLQFDSYYYVPFLLVLSLLTVSALHHETVPREAD